EVAGALALGFAQPQLEGLHRIINARGTNHFNQRGGAADQRGFAGGFMGVLGKGTHEWKINVHVRINESWEDKFAGGIDDFSPRRSGKIRLNPTDGFFFAENVSYVPFAGGDDLAVLDQERHGSIYANWGGLTTVR